MASNGWRRAGKRCLVPAVLAAAVLMTAGCAGSDGPQITEARTGTPLPLPATTGGTASSTATLNLFVTNQSFADPETRIWVKVDGVTVVDQRFEVGAQHVFVAFPLALPPGARRIEAGTGAEPMLTQPVDLHPGAQWAVLTFWSGDGSPRRLEWSLSDTPVAFA